MLTFTLVIGSEKTTYLIVVLSQGKSFFVNHIIMGIFFSILKVNDRFQNEEHHWSPSPTVWHGTNEKGDLPAKMCRIPSGTKDLNRTCLDLALAFPFYKRQLVRNYLRKQEL